MGWGPFNSYFWGIGYIYGTGRFDVWGGGHSVVISWGIGYIYERGRFHVWGGGIQ